MGDGQPPRHGAPVLPRRRTPEDTVNIPVSLARHPEALLVLAALGITWCDWGDPDRILRSLRRIDKWPGWLPVYARAVATGGASMMGVEARGKDKDYATV